MFNNDFNNAIEIRNLFPNEQVCIYHLEKLRWNNTVVSPFDPSSKVYRYQGHKYKCKNTGKYFNVRTGTIFDGTKTPLQKWFVAIWLVTTMNSNIDSVTLSRSVNVPQKTAWSMLNKIKDCYLPDNRS